MGINGAFGSLTGTANGDGTYTATSGTITEFGPVAAGSGVLIANPNAPANANSPSGFFFYNDLLLPGQNPLLDGAGLLFAISGAEINIYSNGPGPGSYTLERNSGAISNGDFALSQIAGTVPEPATWGLMLVGFGGLGAMLRRRRGQIALTA
jgi:hypothetical protein